MIQGLLNFSARKEAPGVVAAFPYERDPNEALIAKPLWKGTPMALSSGNSVRRAITSGGIVTEPKLIGFVSNPDRDTATFGIEFAQMPVLTDRFGRKDVEILLSRGEYIFSAAIASGVAASAQWVGLACGFREQTADQFVVDPTTSGVATQIRIVNVWPEDNGLLGGRVDFIVNAAASSYSLGV